MSAEPAASACKACGGPKLPGRKCAPCHAAYQRDYRARDPARERQRKRESRARHPDTARAWAARNAVKVRAYMHDYNAEHYRKNQVARMLQRAQERAEQAGVPFALTPDDVRIPAVCPVLGIPLQIARGRGGFQPDSPTLDRIVPERGYVPGNVAVISGRANKLKSNGTADELEQVAAWLRRQVGR